MKKPMKKLILDYKAVFVTIILLLISLSPITLAVHKTNYEQFSLTYSFNVPYVEKVAINDNIYDKVIIPGVISAGDTGEPCLPIKGAYILLPQKTQVSDIKVTYWEKVSLGKGYNVVPVGRPIPISQVKSDIYLVPDNEIYNSEDPFPGKLFNEVDTYSFRGYEILVLELFPVEYVPLTGDLFYYEDMTVSISFVDDEGGMNPLFRGSLEA